LRWPMHLSEVIIEQTQKTPIPTDERSGLNRPNAVFKHDLPFKGSLNARIARHVFHDHSLIPLPGRIAGRHPSALGEVFDQPRSDPLVSDDAEVAGAMVEQLNGALVRADKIG